MNLRNWSKDHMKGMLIGMITPLVFIPLVLLFISWMQGYYFERLWTEFNYRTSYQIKIITISIISNLIWFYVFLNKEKWNYAMGVILGSLLYAPYVVYIKFF